MAEWRRLKQSDEVRYERHGKWVLVPEFFADRQASAKPPLSEQTLLELSGADIPNVQALEVSGKTWPNLPIPIPPRPVWFNNPQLAPEEGANCQLLWSELFGVNCETVVSPLPDDQVAVEMQFESAEHLPASSEQAQSEVGEGNSEKPQRTLHSTEKQVVLDPFLEQIEREERGEPKRNDGTGPTTDWDLISTPNPMRQRKRREQ